MREEGQKRCDHAGECFGRVGAICVILKDTRFKGRCPFQKPDRQITNGIQYPLRTYVM